MMDDLISRKAAIDTINKHSVMLEYHVPHTFRELKDDICALPSAQPERLTDNEYTIRELGIEIVRCGDCINYQEQYRDHMKPGWFFCGETETFWPPNGFCYLGERR